MLMPDLKQSDKVKKFYPNLLQFFEGNHVWRFEIADRERI